MHAADAAARALRALWGPRTRPFWTCAGLLLGLFTVLRGLLLVLKYDVLAGQVGWEELAQCFALGLRYDAMPVGYMLLPLAVALPLASDRLLARPGFRRAVVLYAAAAMTVTALAEAFGVAFFLYFGRRLNYMAFAYLAQWETLEYIWENYPAWALAPFLAGVFWAWWWLFKRWFWRGGAAPWSLRRRLVVAAALTAMCALACRGGPQRNALPAGSAHFSGNQVVDQLAMNDFYTMFYAARSRLTDGRDELRAYRLPSPERAAAVVQEMLYQPGDLPAGHPANPLWRHVQGPQARRDLNVVLIVMEGMAGPAVGALGHSPSQTPQLDALCGQGLFFERMYAVGARTSRAMVATLCGHPDLTGTTVMKRQPAIGRFLTLPELLRQRGYQTAFVYGGRAKFDNMGDFLTAGGIDEVLDQDRMHAAAGNWGVPDEVIFRRAHERFEQFGDRPFFAVVLTVSNHDPFEVPAGRVPLLPTAGSDRNKVLNAYHYADWALGEFFQYARQSRYFGNTLFVLVSDHGRNLNQAYMVDVPGFRIPCLVYAPEHVPPGRIGAVCSQTDLPPTILGLLGGPWEHCFLGRDVLRMLPDDGFALLHEDVNLAFLRGQFALVLPPGGEEAGRLYRLTPTGMTAVPPGDADAAQRAALCEQMLSYYTMAHHLYARGAFCSPERFAQAAATPTSAPDAD